jgi:hypothetical protein
MLKQQFSKNFVCMGMLRGVIGLLPASQPLPHELGFQGMEGQEMLHFIFINDRQYQAYLF